MGTRRGTSVAHLKRHMQRLMPCDRAVPLHRLDALLHQVDPAHNPGQMTTASAPQELPPMEAVQSSPAAKAVEPTKSAHLGKLGAYRLYGLVQAEFVKRRETDKAFAEFASKELGIEVNDDHIKAARNDLGITATRFVLASAKKSNNPDSLRNRVQSLEKQVADLQRAVLALSA